MNSFEWNKIFAAGLISLLVMMVASLIGHGFVKPKFLQKNVYEVEVAAVSTPTEAEAEPVAITPLLAQADVAKGEEIFKKCTQCHAIAKGGNNKIGPNLWNIVGSAAGKVAGFAYSSAFAALKINWDFENLSHFLENPRKFVPGTKMSFAGLAKPQDRANVIAYMRAQSDNPVPMP